MKTIADFLDTPDFRLLIGSDHGGFEAKAALLKYLCDRGIAVTDVGPCTLDPADDYPDYAGILARAVSRGEAVGGILICRTGLGMCINANRFHGVRAIVAYEPQVAQISRSHNASNLLVTGGNDMNRERLQTIVDAWLETPYSKEERHTRRLLKIERNSYDPNWPLRWADPEAAAIVDREDVRQRQRLQMIASENYASAAVRAAVGSSLTNKYAEGYPGKRYYFGCEHADEIEQLAIDRVCALFGAEAANVQAHSGSQANMAAYFALLKPGDRVLAMSLAHGGHLTHGMHINFSGRLYEFASYGVAPGTEVLDYDAIAEQAAEFRPKMLVAGASAYPRILDFERLRAIADSVGAYLMVDMAHIAGLVAAGVHPNPVPWADIVTSTTHKTLRGPRGGLVLCRDKYLKKLNSQVFPGIQGGPLMNVVAGKAVCFGEALRPSFKTYGRQIVDNAQALADALADLGFRIVSGGTDNHLMLVDVRPMGTTGDVAGAALDRAGITANKNLIPFDPEKPTVTSGIRLGTPMLTSRGMDADDMRQVARWIHRVVSNIGDAAVEAEVRAEVASFAAGFPTLDVEEDGDD